MRAYFCDSFVLSLPATHRFPMAKYARLRERVAAYTEPLNIELCVPPPASDADLLRVHTQAYFERVRDATLSTAEQRKIGFPASPQMFQRSRRVSGATLHALLDALDSGVAVNLAGGTHHAFADHGGGYCVFNDSVVAARGVQARGAATRVLIIDLDVHQGDGTAALCANDSTITTFSMHAARNYPAEKQRSDLDVALPDGTGDAEYLAALQANLPKAFDLARPDCAIYLAGADPYAGDRLGLLKLSKAGLSARDRIVHAACLARGVPLAVTMAGGYAEQIDDIVDIHLSTVQTAAHYARLYPKLDKPPRVFACTQADD